MSKKLISVFVPTYLGRGNGTTGFMIWKEEDGTHSIVFFYSVVQVAQLMRIVAPSPLSLEYFAWEAQNAFIRDNLLSVTLLAPVSDREPLKVEGPCPWHKPECVQLCEGDAAWALNHLLSVLGLSTESELNADTGVLQLACNYMAHCLGVPPPGI